MHSYPAHNNILMHHDISAHSRTISIANDKRELSREEVRDHMANERTFLSWIRTSIAIMAFGFVVEKFSLFLKQIVSFVGKDHTKTPSGIAPNLLGHSTILGIILVAIGSFICLLAFIRYKKIERQINLNSFKPTLTIDLMLAATLFLIGLFLTIYLLNSL